MAAAECYSVTFYDTACRPLSWSSQSSPSQQLPLEMMADTIMRMMSAGHLSRGASHAAQGRSRSLSGAFRQLHLELIPLNPHNKQQHCSFNF